LGSQKYPYKTLSIPLLENLNFRANDSFEILVKENTTVFLEKGIA